MKGFLLRYAFPLVALSLAVTIGMGAETTDAIAVGEAPGEHCGGTAGGCEAPSDARQAPSEAEVALAEKHAPAVYLKQQTARCDSKGEAFYPTAVDIVLDSEAVRLVDADGAVVMTAPGAGDVAGLGEGVYVDFPGDPQHPGCRYETDFRALSPAPEPVVYARIAREEGYDELALQYWFFYYFNDFNNTHEGDWEYIQLTFEAESAEEALGLEPSRVIFSQHAGGERADWSDDKLSKEGSRPVVYVAKGSHANQFRQRNHLGKGQNGSGFGCDDATGPSVRVDPAVVVLPTDVADAEDDLAWLRFAGHWGELKKGYFDGPTGPGEKKLWSNPISTMNAQRDSSVQVPERTIGPSAADAFCDVVAWSSAQLFQRGPYVFLAMVIGAVGTIGLTSSARGSGRWSARRCECAAASARSYAPPCVSSESTGACSWASAPCSFRRASSQAPCSSW